jgi:hypothetical protein
MTEGNYGTRKKVWKRLTPLFPFLRTKFGFLRYLRYKGRETYPIGYIKKDLTLAKLESELRTQGFERYCVAWIDQGEVLGMRKSEGFEMQYHVRIFNDGEVRGHFELTPEYRAFKHFFDIGKIARTEDFITMIGHLLEPNSEVNTITL